jgi:6-phosphogluconolactonase (cycloisomerase 2 family)
MTKIARAGLALWPLLWTACGAPMTPTPAPSAPPGPQAFLLSLTTEAYRDSVLRTLAIGSDGRLGEARDLALATTPNGPFVDAQRGLVFLIEHDLVGTALYRPALVRYRLDPLTGALLPYGRARFGSTRTSPGITASLHPNGRFLYTDGDGPGEVDGYRVETGSVLAVERLPGSPFTSREAHGYPNVGAPRVSPSGRFAWSHASIIYKTQGLLSFRVSPETGALELVGAMRVYDAESNLAPDPQERFAFQVAGGFLRRWWTYGIDGESGALSQAGDSEPLRPVYAYRLLAVPSGRWLVAADGEGTVRSLEVTADGRLLARQELALDDDGQVVLAGHERMVYLASKGGLRALRLDEATGALEVVQELAGGADPVSLAVARVPATADCL